MNSVEKNFVNATRSIEIKRPYEAPMLSEYGDIRQITQTTNNQGNLDGGSGNNKRSGNK
jgi:hypothetical protein